MILAQAAGSTGSSFLPALLGALVGGTFSLAGTLLGNYLTIHRERARQIFAEQQTVHNDVTRWWHDAELEFANSRQILRDAENSNPPIDDTQLAELVGTQVQCLRRLVPPGLARRLLVYGDDEAARRLSGAEAKLLGLSIAARHQAKPELYDYVDKQDREDRILNDRAELRTGSYLIFEIQTSFDSAVRAIDLKQYSEREQLRGSSRPIGPS